MKKIFFLIVGVIALCSFGCSNSDSVGKSAAGSKAPTTKGWEAWLNKMPMSPHSILVTGQVETTAGNMTPELAKASPQGINPNILLLDLSLKTSSGVGTAVMGFKQARFDEKPAAADYTEVHIRYEGAVIEKITVKVAQ